MCCVVLSSMLDVNLLDAYITELVQPTPGAAHRRRSCLLAFNHVLQLYAQLLHFLRVCACTDDVIRADLLQDKLALKHVVKLLGVAYQGE